MCTYACILEKKLYLCSVQLNDLKFTTMNEEKRKALSALGSLMACNEVCRNQRAVMKINRFRAWLMDLKPEPNSHFDGEQPNN